MTELLLTALRQRANNRGLVLAREGVLRATLRCSAEELTRELAALSDAGMVEILSPLPFLVLALRPRSWSDTRSEPLKPANKTEPSLHHAYSYPMQLFNQEQLNNSYRPGELAANDGLLHEILETLGETDPSSFRKAVENYPPSVIRTALNRVRRAKSIRKNRTALFRHLLPRIAQDSQHSN